MRICILIPTYNERGNIERLIPRLLGLPVSPSILVIDDNSPDGTGSWVEALSDSDKRVSVAHRPGKLGLGTAYIHGMQIALERGFTHLVTMDADFSHDPEDVPRLIAAADHCDLVIGSRYVRGGGTQNWGLHRKVLSRVANLIARPVLGGGVRDSTAGFRCYRSALLARMPLDRIASNGYAFQVEMVHEALKAGGRVQELPILFTDRMEGRSKMSGRIVGEAARLLVRIGLERARRNRP